MVRIACELQTPYGYGGDGSAVPGIAAPEFTVCDAKVMTLSAESRTSSLIAAVAGKRVTALSESLRVTVFTLSKPLPVGTVTRRLTGRVNLVSSMRMRMHAASL